MIVDDTPESRPTARSTAWLFLPCILIAGALYALATLSSRILDFDTYRASSFQQQAELVQLEERCLHLATINRELRRDPRFAGELERRQQADESPTAMQQTDDSASIQLDKDLQFDGREMKTTELRTTYSTPWYIDRLKDFHSRPHARELSLTLASVLLLVAFSFRRPVVSIESESENFRRDSKEDFAETNQRKGFFSRYARKT